MSESGLSEGSSLYRLVEDLFPLHRSITGDGLRRTLERIREEIPLEVVEVPSGTAVLDWAVPLEWNIRDAYIKNSAGERVVDFQSNNLHVVAYSTPVAGRMSLEQLRPHLHSMPDKPEWIPYRMSYYREGWGFCLAHRVLEILPEDDYEVCIDSSLEPGHLTYGEYVIPGETTDEVLISAHVCHPSLANDNLAGIAIAVALAQKLAKTRNRYTYRFVFAAATIGAITWLARNQEKVRRIRHGFVLACAGDPGTSTYKRSRSGTAPIDRAAGHVLLHSGTDYTLEDFSPYGYDERQYGSPGFNLPIGALMRTPNGKYPEYHTSADNLDLVTPEAIADTFSKAARIIDVLEHDRFYVNLSPYGEPQLGRRGLYEGIGSGTAPPGYEMALLWVLNLSDGEHSLLDIAERADLAFDTIRNAADGLAAAGLLREISCDMARPQPEDKIGFPPSPSEMPRR